MARNGWDFIAVNSAGDAPAGGCLAEAYVEMSAAPRIFCIFVRPLNKNLFLEHLKSYFLENALARPPVPPPTGLGGIRFRRAPEGHFKINLFQARLRNRLAAMFLYGHLDAVCHSTLRLRL